MRLQILVQFLRCLLQAVACSIEIGVRFQGENDEISGLQWLNDDLQILVAAADACGSLTKNLVNGLQMVQHDALIGEMQPVGVSVEGAFELDGFAVVICKSRGDGSMHRVQ